MTYKNRYFVNKKQADIYSLNNNQFYPKKDLTDKIDDYKNLDDNGLRYAFLGHSSVYVKINNHSILIDPVFSKVLGPFPDLGIHRFISKTLKAELFPSIDLVLITHNHFDHLDSRTIKSLDKQTEYFVVPKGIKQLLVLFGIKQNKIIELNWDETFKYEDLEVCCLPAHHTSTRYIFDLNKTLWCSYVIKNEKYKIYHSGDTAFSKHFIDIANKYHDFDLLFMECGQYGTLWHDMHMFPEESVMACTILKSKVSIPIHWGAFRLSNHSYDEPIIRFSKEANKKGIHYQIPSIYKLYSI